MKGFLVGLKNLGMKNENHISQRCRNENGRMRVKNKLTFLHFNKIKVRITIIIIIN